jgi:WD40 repeat protein/serine/threonine protein kinase
MTDDTFDLEGLVATFQLAWESGEPPNLFDYWAAIPQNSKGDVIPRILKIDIDHRSKKMVDFHPDFYSVLGSEISELAKKLIVDLTGSNGRVDNEASESPTRDRSKNGLPSSSFWLKPTQDGTASVKPSIQIGRYKLLQRIGEGGMGQVWMAEQETPVRRRVALKIIKSNMADRQFIARFEAERQALAMMDHQNIAKVLDAGSFENQPYLVMELIKGTPITKFCDDHRLSIKERLQLFIPVCKAVQHAHQKGIIHRDLKPSNVLVTLLDGKPFAKVIDFGLAKAIEHSTKLTDKTMFTELGRIVGTVQYMSPEQAETSALDVDTRTDIYSLGVMLYELLTGSTPLDQATLGQKALIKILEIIREKDPPRPSTRLSSIGESVSAIGALRKIAPSRLQQILRGELDWVVMKALDKDRRRRYETANDFSEDIQRYLNDEAVTARPPSAVYKLGKLVKKNKGFAASVMAIVFLMMGAVVVSNWFAIQANIAKQDAMNQTVQAENQRKIAEAKTKLAAIKTAEVTQERDRANQNERMAIAEQAKAVNAFEKLQAVAARGSFFLAQACWNSNRVQKANENLELIPNRFRNIEWYLARREFQGSYMTGYGHFDFVSDVAISPDGSTIASVSFEELKLWDAASGSELTTLTNDWKGTSVAFNFDGSLIVSGSLDKMFKIWDTVSGQEIRTFYGHEGFVNDVAFSPDGSQIVSASKDTSIRLWDVSTSKEIQSFNGHTAAVACVAFLPNGSGIISGSDDRTLKLWDVAGGEEIRTYSGHLNGITSLDISSDGRRVVSGSGYSLAGDRIRLWDVSSGDVLLELDRDAEIASVSLSPDGTQVAASGRGSAPIVKVWNAITGKELHELKGHQDYVSGVVYSPDGTRLVTSSWDRTLKFWDLVDSDISRSIWSRNGFSCLDFSPDGNQIATGENDGTITLWDVVPRRRIRTLRGHPDGVVSLKFSPDGTQIVSVGKDNLLRVVDVSTGEEVHILRGHQDAITCLAMSSDGKLIVSGSVDKTVKIWDAFSGSELKTLSGHTARITSVGFSPDNSKIISAGGFQDGSIKIWRIADGTDVQTLRDGNEIFTSVSFSRDGKEISGCGNEVIKRWNWSTGTVLRSIELNVSNSTLSHLVYSPDETRIFTSSLDDRTTLLDAMTGEELWDGEGDNFVVSPDARRFACSDFPIVKIWEASAETEVWMIRGHSSEVSSVAISPDGTRVVSTSADEKILLWDALSGTQLQSLAGVGGMVSEIALNSDSTRIYARGGKKRFVWDAETGRLLDDEQWEDAYKPNQTSVHGRWLLNEAGDSHFLNLDFKNRPIEQEIRNSKAQLRGNWHFDQMSNAMESQDWFVATIHAAWLMKSEPEPWNYDLLHDAYSKLAKQLEKDKSDSPLVLPRICMEMLAVKRGSDE